ncbi:MAG: YcjF family protein [Polyangiales bacterium]
MTATTTTYTDTVGRVMSGDFDYETEQERDQAVRDVIQVCSAASGAVAVQPFPVADIALLAPIQIGMVQAIGRIRGCSIDHRTALEILSTFGATLVSHGVVRTSVRLVPVFGWLMGISMSYASTWALGEVSDVWFRCGRDVPPADLRAMFREIYAKKKAEKQAEHRGDDSLEQRLDDLGRAYERGLIDEEEFRKKKEEMLRDF